MGFNGLDGGSVGNEPAEPGMSRLGARGSVATENPDGEGENGASVAAEQQQGINPA